MVNLITLIHDEMHFINNNGETLLSKQGFLCNVKKIANYLKENNLKSIALGPECPMQFSVAFFGALLNQSDIIITHNKTSGALKELKDHYDTFIDTINLHTKNFSHIQEEQLKISLESKITLSTSGSSGQPKIIKKKLKHFINEVEILEGMFGKNLGRATIATVSQQHIYGLLYRLLWPIIKGRAICTQTMVYLEDINNFEKSKYSTTLIASPAFYKRIGPNEPFSKSLITLFSSGGPLTTQSAQTIYNLTNNNIIEIYGCTEAGGIATRKQLISPLWAPFPCVNIEADDEGEIQVSGPFFDEDFLKTGDLIEIAHDKTFTLVGRRDSTVKVEEKRIDIKEMENKLLSNENVKDAYCFTAEEKNRTVICAIIVIHKESHLNFFSKIQKNNYFKEVLANYFDKVLLPKKFRYTESIPYNQQSKIEKSKILELINE